MKKKKQIFSGTVVGISKYMEGTIKVNVTRSFIHPIYNKVQKRNKNYLVNSEKGRLYQISEKVKIIKRAPVSKKKHWQILEGEQK